MELSIGRGTDDVKRGEWVERLQRRREPVTSRPRETETVASLGTPDNGSFDILSDERFWDLRGWKDLSSPANQGLYERHFERVVYEIRDGGVKTQIVKSNRDRRWSCRDGEIARKSHHKRIALGEHGFTILTDDGPPYQSPIRRFESPSSRSVRHQTGMWKRGP